MAAFLVIETRSHSPLVPLGIFKRRTLAGANLIGFGLGTTIFGMFFLLSLYMQIVLGFSALQTGVGYLAVALTAVASSGIAQALVTRLGVKPVLATGMALLCAGLILFTQVSVDGTYVADLLPGFILVGVGLGFSFVPVSIAALAGITGTEAGLASGLINTSQQIGGALGLAILTTVSTTTDRQPDAPGTTALAHRPRRRLQRRLLGSGRLRRDLVRDRRSSSSSARTSSARRRRTRRRPSR